MPEQTIALDYDATKKAATLTFPNGRRMALENVSEEQAQTFVKRHGQEFMRRDCVLHTTGDIQVREGGEHG